MINHAKEYLRDAFEDLAIKNADGIYEMANVYETTIDLSMADSNRIPHHLPCITKAGFMQNRCLEIPL